MINKLSSLGAVLKQLFKTPLLKLLLTGSVALAFIIIVLGPLWVTAKRGLANYQENVVVDVTNPMISVDQRSNALQTGSTLQIIQTFDAEHGVDNVANGDLITFTFRITNLDTLNSIREIVIIDELPQDALQDITADELGQKVLVEQSIPSLRGGSVITVDQTASILWYIAELEPEASLELFVSGRVKCQTDGAVFDNTGNTDSVGGGSPNSNTIAVTVTVRAASTGADVSDGPTWCSNDLGGNFDIDWGDYDQDGDLDLALGSTLGTNVYENRDGQLVLFWPKSNRYTLGLRWADVNGDGDLELIAVGASEKSPDGRTVYVNYIYEYTGNTFDDYFSFFSDFQLLRATPGDYDNDGDIDLIVSSTALDVSYPVRLYRNPGNGWFEGRGEFVSSEATADVGSADFDNDGDLDIAVGRFQSKDIMIFKNNDGVLTETNILTEGIQVARSISFPPYNFAWGDYDGDGYLDLAAALSLQRQVHIYRNLNGVAFDSPQIIRNQAVLSPRVLDWVDMNGDGHLDLVLVDAQPLIYIYDPSDDSFKEDPNIKLSTPLVGSQVWSMRGMDYDNDGDLDLAIGNQDRPMMLFTSFTPRLAQDMQRIGSFAASSVAWGDINRDGKLDLVFGAGMDTKVPGTVHVKLYNNDDGTFPVQQTIRSGSGPNSVAFADADADGLLDLAVGNEGREDTIYGSVIETEDWNFSQAFTTTSLAWGDSDEDSDFKPDLLVGVAGEPNIVYFNDSQNGDFDYSKRWQTPESDNTTSVAWGNYNAYSNDFTDYNPDYTDGNLDFAVGNYGQPNRIYRNDGLRGFDLVWSTPFSNNTTSIAWGDYDGDGDLDLLAGNDKQPIYLYENQTAMGVISFTLVWTSTQSNHTTSLAWADWDNDGDLDFAVGNYDTYDYVYSNQGSLPGVPLFDVLWKSTEAYSTTGLAWGDKDQDGDLDLAASRDVGVWSLNDPNRPTQYSGVYENLAVSPSHLTNVFDPKTIPLRNNPSYMSVEKPGTTETAYFYSASEMLKGDVEVPHTAYDPDGAKGVRDIRSVGAPGPGNPVISMSHQFSLNGGGGWQRATPAQSMGVLVPSRLGESTTFLWDSITDQAISDNAVLRSCAFYQNPTGPTQYASSCTLSPPFRVRGTFCNWPDGASISYVPALSGKPILFSGQVDVGSGGIYYEWDFGDGSPIDDSGRLFINHTYESSGWYVVTLSVTGDPCPITKRLILTETIYIPSGLTYLPSVLKNYTPGMTDTVTSTLRTNAPVYIVPREAASVPASVAGLQGSTDLEVGGTYLSWQPNSAADQVTHYYVYRRPRHLNTPFRRLAILPTETTTYTDPKVRCGYTYIIVAVNTHGESLPSLGSYYSPRCE